MSRIRQEISSVQFQIDARKANASMDALQEKAKDLNKDIEKTQADIKALGDVAPDNNQLLEFQKTLRGLTRDLNDVTRAQNELIKGVKAADKLWKAAQEGNIESLGVKSIKAGQRGLQQRMQSLQPGDEADAKVLRAYKAVIEEADIVMLKFKTDAANTLKILDEGGSVSARTMRETRDNLKELVDITPKATAEYKEFKSQLDQMESRMNSLTETERRLAGEIVTVADAMKMAGRTSREQAEAEAKQAKAEMEKQENVRSIFETQAEGSRRRIENAEKEAASIKEQITEQEKLLKSQEALYEASGRADKEVDEARQKRDAARESTKQYTDAITTAANKVADLKKQLDELNATTAKPKVDTKEAEAELQRLKSELEGIRRYRAAAESKKEAAEQALGGKEIWENERYIKAYEEDKIASEEAVKKLDAKWDEFWEKQEKQAHEFAALLGKMSTEEVSWDDFRQHVTGPNAELAKSWYRTTQRSINGIDYWGEDSYLYKDLVRLRAFKKTDVATAEQLEELKVLESLKRKWDEYWRARDKAEQERPKSSAVFDELDKHKQEAIQADVAIEVATDKAKKIKEQIAEQEKLIETTKAETKSVEELKKQLEELNATASQPTGQNPIIEGLRKEAEVADSAIAKLEARLKELNNPDRIKIGTPQEEIAAAIGMGGKGGNNATIFSKLQSQMSDALVDQDETTVRAFLRAGGFTGVLDKDSLTHYRGTSKKDMITQLTEYINNRLEGYDVSDDTYGIASGGKYYDMDWLDELTAKERQKFLELSYEKQKAWVERAVKKQFGEIDAIIYQGADEATAYVGKGDGAEMGLRSVMNAEMWKGGKSESDAAGIPQAEIERQEALITNTKELIRQNDELAQTEHLLETSKKARAEIDEKIAQATEQQSKAQEESVDADKKKAEVTKQLADAQAELGKATKDAEEPKKKLAKAEDDLTEAEKKQTKAYEDLNAAREKQDFKGENEKLDQLERQYDELTGSIEKEKQALTENATAAKEAYDKETEAAIEMAQAQNYSQKSLEDSIALLEKQSKVETDPKKYKEMTTAIETMQQRVKEMTGEWMSYAEAEKYAESIGTDGFIATSDQLQKATQSLTRYKDTLIKTIQQKRDDGKATAEEEAELKKVEAELKKMKFEMDNANMSSKRMHEILKDPKSAKNIEELSAAIKRSTQELKLMEETIGKDNAKYKEMAEQTKKATIEQKNMEAQFKASASAFEKAWSRLKTYVGLYVGAAVAMQKIVATMGDLMELSDKMGEVRKTTGFTADEVGRLSTALAKMDTRTTLTGLMELSAVAGQLGLKTEQDVRGFTEAANMLMVALPEMGKEGATAMLKVALATGEIDKIRQQMQDGLVEGSDAVSVAMTKIGSTIDSLRANSAAAAPAITDFVKRVGAVGAQSGITIDQVAALGSTVDALGMRVEMSATALSRMIPAIKNNAFEIAKAIGVTPETIRGLFDAGRGMEAILMIFQHIKDQGLDEDGIEKMMGMGGMADIMKDLNQQGARAGIVFAGLSQNVDELRRQLGVAKNAYEENIAIQAEYDKMNETTAAKWERLKNQLEEMFVGDTAQRWLGGIIDGLRNIVDLISGPLRGAFFGLSAGFASFKLGIGSGIQSLVEGLKDLASGEESVSDKLKVLWEKLKDGTVWDIAVSGVIAAGVAIYEYATAVSSANKALADLKVQIDAAIDQFEGYYHKLNETSTALQKAKENHTSLSAEVDKLRESTDGSAESTANLKKKEDELKKAEDDVTLASNDHRNAIADMNSIYGKYLGFMLTEANYADMAATAHDKVAAAIRREMLAKQEEAALSRVYDDYTADLAEDLGALSEELTEAGRLTVQQAAKAKRDLQKFLRENIKYDVDKGEYDTSKAQQLLAGKKYDLSGANPQQVIAVWFNEYLKDTFHLNQYARQDITGIAESGNSGYGNYLDLANLRGDYASTYLDFLKDQSETIDVFAGELQDAKEEDEAATRTLLEKLKKQAEAAQAKITNSATTEKDHKKAYEDLANALEGIDNNIEKVSQKDNADLIRSLKEQAENINKTVNATMLKAARTRAHSIFDRATGGTGGGGGGETHENPWGRSLPAESTDWKNMTAEALVRRRKQMKDFVNSIQTDTDVKAVLEEDAALKKAIEKGMSSDMRTVIEWYNTERLKIQDELHARHLTNTGDWMDPKKGSKKASKLVQDEMKYYLDELDAYYTERKAKIQEERNDELITEGEAWRKTLLIEAEWQQRRGELQQLYGTRREKVTKEETAAILDILSERTEETTDYIKKDIENTVKFIERVGSEKGKAAMDKIYGDIDLGSEKAYLRQRNAIGKQVQFMTDTLAKERPFNGITENLQENLTKMGILVGQVPEKMHFLLGQIEDAYTLDVKEMVKRISEAGFKEWAEQISGNTQMQQALLAQLRQAYEAVQEGIRKEASRIKKDADMMWKLMLLPDGTNLKQAADDALAKMTQRQESVSRANSLIGAGTASENVVTRLAVKQLQLQLSVQQAQYALMRKMGEEKAQYLDQLAEEYKLAGDLKKAERARIDAANVRKSINLAITEETKKQAELNRQIAKEQEEAQNRLYTSLREWADVLSSGLQGVFEASNSGNEEYYNKRAVLEAEGSFLTKSKKTTSTTTSDKGTSTKTTVSTTTPLQDYYIIENAGTSDATARKESLTELEYLEKQHEIEQHNARMEAWKKLMDDINAKMNDTITDQLNAMMQNASLDANTQALGNVQMALGNEQAAITQEQVEVVNNTLALGTNTEALATLSEKIDGMNGGDGSLGGALGNLVGSAIEGTAENTVGVLAPTGSEQTQIGTDWGSMDIAFPSTEAANEWAQQRIELNNQVTQNAITNAGKRQKAEAESDNKIAGSAQSAFAKMIQAANLYGAAYAAVSNDNMSWSQKFASIAVQAAGNTAITMLTTKMSETAASTTADTPAVLSKLWKQLGWGAVPVFAIFTGLLGGLMGLAASAISKGKSEIASATGASNSVASGRLATGMLTYASGNVNEFTDPDTLTPGRQYNVDAADGRTYRARYMGRNPKTHITNGPEFHLAGERGREAIIDAHTTRQIQMDDSGIWQAIKTLSAGGSIQGFRPRRNGMRAFADGNIDAIDSIDAIDTMGTMGGGGMTAEQVAALQSSLDRNSEVLERALSEGIKGVFDVHGPKGLIDSYDTGKKIAQRHGQRY